MSDSVMVPVDRFRAYVPLTKFDATTGIGEGVLAVEEIDNTGEKMDYESSKPLFKAWSTDVFEKSNGKSKGNLRRQHDPHKAIGKITEMLFDDEGRRIIVQFRVTDPLSKMDCEEGVLTGLSIGGRYLKKWIDQEDGAVMRYTAAPVEASLVDRPAMPNATFIYKADGAEAVIRKEFSNVRGVAQVWYCGHEDCPDRHVRKSDAVSCQGAGNFEKEATMPEETTPAVEEPTVAAPEPVVVEEPAPEPEPATEPVAKAYEPEDLAKAVASAMEPLTERIATLENALIELTGLLSHAATEEPVAKAAQPPEPKRPQLRQAATKEQDTGGPAPAPIQKADDASAEDLIKAAFAQPRPVIFHR